VGGEALRAFRMSAWLDLLRRKRLAILGVAVVLLLATWMLWGLLAPHRDPFVEAIRKRGYPATLAELDAWYPSVPQAENVALAYTNALGLLTSSSGQITNFIGRNWLPAIGRGLSAEERDELKAALSENQDALRLLYSAPASGRSRYPIRLEDAFTVLLPHLAKMKQAVSLLTAEALMHASDGDAEKATQAFLVAGRLIDSVAEEPLVVSQLVRYANWAILLPRLERALSLTAFSDSQLAALQRMTESAERPQAVLRAWAGEQAAGLSVFIDRRMMETALRGFQSAGSKSDNLRVAACMTLFRITGLLQKDKAVYCETMGRNLAALELPYPARFAACQQLAAITNLPNRFCIFSRMLLPALGKLHLREADHTALVRVAAAALAIERFRLAHTNALPESLEQLVPACCKLLPRDPIDGAPLRYKTRGASYAVYSIGSDGQDDGGAVWDSNYTKAPQDISFVVKH
jgi:hypothetical protein